MAEVIMGMYQEMVVLREQAKPLMVGRCQLVTRRANKKGNSNGAPQQRARRARASKEPQRRPMSIVDRHLTTTYSLLWLTVSSQDDVNSKNATGY